MSDFLITQLIMYPWLAWVLAVFTVMSLVFWFLLGLAGAKAWLDWVEMRREDQRILADILARAHADDPPEYQPDEDPDGLVWCDVCKAERPQDCICGEDADEDWPETLRSIAVALASMNDDDQLPDRPPAEPERPMPGLCSDMECERYGWRHYPPCTILATMPGLVLTGRQGPAGPPNDWSGHAASLETLYRGDGERLHPASQRDLEAAGFKPHDDTVSLVDTSFTRAMAREVREKEAGK